MNPDPAITSFADLLDDAQLISHEVQLQFQDLVGEEPPTDLAVDLDRGRFTMTLADGETLVAGVDFLGTAAPGPGSWLWGWHNISGLPPSALLSAERVRSFGRQHGVAELVDAEQPLTAEPRVEAGRYGAVASLVCDCRPIYTYEAGGGTVGALLLDIPGFALPPPEMPRVLRVCGEVVSWAGVSNWRRALASYGRLRGLAVTQMASGVRLTSAQLDLTATVDEQGRLTNLTGNG